VNYCCNPQCIWVWGNSDFPTPFSFMYNVIMLSGTMLQESNHEYYRNKNCYSQSCQFHFVLPGMAETFHTNSNNGTKRNNFHLILNLGPFRIFWLNFGRNVPVSFHMFRSALEKPLNFNQIEPYSI